MCGAHTHTPRNSIYLMVRKFQPGNVTGWGSEGVKTAALFESIATFQRSSLLLWWPRLPASMPDHLSSPRVIILVRTYFSQSMP